MSTTTNIHTKNLQTCLSLARNSPPKPTNFRVGAILLLRPTTKDPEQESESEQTILSTGYTLELPGNTHAEQCALTKYATSHSLPEESVGEILPPPDSTGKEVVLYVTMEPCGKRLSGNLPCVQRIIQTRGAGEGKGIRKVYFGVKEPGTFVGESEGCRRLTEAGIEWEVVTGLEEEILRVAKEGHVEEEGRQEGRGTNVDDISSEERRRQEQLPKNPKKRMMEV